MTPPDFHFVTDYEKHVANLLAEHPRKEAMELAIGGGWEQFQSVEVQALVYAGLTNGMSILDFGCGSGRLAQGLARTGLAVSYTGIDIVSALLEYAREICPPDYSFIISQSRFIPIPDCSMDMMSAFSVFTHLLPEESFIYLEEARRLLKPGGQVVFSFLEFADESHWATFENTVINAKTNTQPHLNAFLSREAITAFARHLGFQCRLFVSGSDAPWGGSPLGQSLAILQKAIS